jgi:hypothetical protein
LHFLTIEKVTTFLQCAVALFANPRAQPHYKEHFLQVAVLRLSKYSKKQVQIENRMDLTRKLPGEKKDVLRLGH